MTPELNKTIRDAIEYWMESGCSKEHVMELSDPENIEWHSYGGYDEKDISTVFDELLKEEIIVEDPEDEGWYWHKTYSKRSHAYCIGLKKWQHIDDGDILILNSAGSSRKIKVCDFNYDIRTSVFDENNREYFLDDYEIVYETEDEKLLRWEKEDAEEKALAEIFERETRIKNQRFDDMDKEIRNRVNSLNHNVVFGPGPFGICVKCQKRVEIDVDNLIYYGAAVEKPCK